MRRFYQSSWQGVPFPVSAHVSFLRLASNEFYASFFEELFRRLHSWESLPQYWRDGKSKDAHWLAEQITIQQEAFIAHNAAGSAAQPDVEKSDTPKQSPRILSVAHGVGYMEKVLLEVVPHIELHINSPNTAGLRWLREIIPSEQIYIGAPAVCLPPHTQYDVICLSAVDHGFSNRKLALTLRELKAQLMPHGKIVCISGSLLEEDSFMGSLVNAFKIGLRAVLHLSSLRRQQFWGWRRTRAEYQQFFKNAGFTNIKDGWLDDGSYSYWISGE